MWGCGRLRGYGSGLLCCKCREWFSTACVPGGVPKAWAVFFDTYEAAPG